IGDAGSGKSTLIKHLFLNSIKEKIGVPILIELRYLNNEEQSIEEYIISKIFENKLTQNNVILERLLKKGKFVFFLDGYDELNTDIKLRIIENLNSFVNKYSNNKFILTTRPHSNIEHLPLFHNFVMKSLSGQEINEFIKLQLSKESELSDKIIKSLKENKSEYISEFLTNPLLLSLYILTFQSNSEIPNKKYVFYRRVINALFSEHDSKTKLGYVREKQSKLNQEQFEEVLKAFSFLSYFESKFNFDKEYILTKLKLIKGKIPNINFDNNKFIYDLKSAIALWTEDYGIISFAHRSIQEYFAALFVQNLNVIDKEKIYNKILDKQSKSNDIREIENFLSICEELDTIYFYKFYGLPLLKEMREHFVKCNTDTELVGRFIQFFLTKFPERIHLVLHEGLFSELFNKSVYFNLPYIQKLFSFLQEFDSKNIIPESCNYELIDRQLMIAPDEIGGKYEEKIVKEKIIDITEEFPEELAKAVSDKKIIKEGKKFVKFIDTKIEEYEKYIEYSIGLDKDLVDLI
ncbi:MAG: NACHT domain-containing protein, partial [Leptospiraceae bacterium]|nr:NACHT domain-containing protein [Leptospiraceae bacterium]